MFVYVPSTLLDRRKISDEDDRYKRQMLALLGGSKYRALTGDKVLE